MIKLTCPRSRTNNNKNEIHRLLSSFTSFHFSFDLGAGSKTVTSALRYRPNRWIKLRIYRHNKRVEIFFNSRRVASGVSPGDSFVSNLHTVLYFGKADQLIEGKT